MRRKALLALVLLGGHCLDALPARCAPPPVPAGSLGSAVLESLGPQGGTLRVNLPGAGSVSFLLSPARLLDPTAAITTTDDAGSHSFPVAIPIYRGRGSESADDWAVVSVTAHGTLGLVVAGGRTFALRSALGAPGRPLALEPESYQPWVCKAPDLPRLARAEPAQPAAPSINKTGKMLVCHLALDCDYDLINHRFSGDSLAAVQYVLTLVTEVSEIYRQDLNVTMRISYLNFWTTPQDPYNSPDVVEESDQFRNYWFDHRKSVSRDLAYLFTGRLVGGTAFDIDVLCGRGGAYAVGGVFGPDSHPVDVRVTAHELGHIFGSAHTFSCFWQANGYTPPGTLLDSCQAATAAEGGCYNGPSFIVPPGGGTIMGYCYPFQLAFHPACIARMRGETERACLQPEESQLVMQSPLGGEEWVIGESRSISWARVSGIGGARVELSRDAGQHWETLSEDAPSTNFNWKVTGPESGNCRLRITAPDLTGAADSSEVEFEIAVKSGFSLPAPSPNPLAGDLLVALSLPPHEAGRLELFDDSGRRLRSVAVTQVGKSVVAVAQKAELGAGVYFLRLTTARHAARQKLVLIH